MDRTRFEFETSDGGKHLLTATSGDSIALSRQLKAEGIDLRDMSVKEYVHRLAYVTGQRVGIVPEDQGFDEWTYTVEAFDDDPKTDADPEVGATPV